MIESGSLVIINCGSPKEKLWGVLLRLDPVGAVVRGLDLDSVEDWIRQERNDSGSLITPFTFLIPTHRILRIDLEEGGGPVESFGDRFAVVCGRDVRDALLETPDREDA
jgi:hypothetical protein